MNADIRKDILEVIKQSIELFKEKDFSAIRELSNKTIHNASIFQDSDSISIAIVMYALSKIGERPQSPKYLKIILRKIRDCKQLLVDNDDLGYHESIKEIFHLISEYDSKFKMYLDEVISKAKVKKGSSLHAHGISVARTAEILGIGQWELMSYIGKTRIHDEFIGRIDIRKRLEFARSLFS